MRAVIQRVSSASLVIDGHQHAAIDKGLVVLFAVEAGDHEYPNDISWLVKKIAQLRIFEDEAGKMNRSLEDVSGDILIVSQFTLYGDVKKGNRPSFIKSARPEEAIPIYEQFVREMSARIKKVETGVFAADMKVSLTNDGPVTLVIDTPKK